MLTYAAISFVCSFFFISSMLLGGDDAMDGGDTDLDQTEGFKIFSFRSLMFFGMGFGAAGAFASYAGYGAFGSGLLATLSGVVFVVFAGVIFKFVYAQQASTNFDSEELVGKTGNLVVATAPNMPGQVLTRDDHGRAVYCTVRGKSLIPEGSEVKIVRVEGGVVEVERVIR